MFNYSDTMNWALGQIGKVITYCFMWFDDLMSAFNADKLLIGIFACGVLGTLFLTPIFGKGAAGLGADSVKPSKREESDEEIFL